MTQAHGLKALKITPLCQLQDLGRSGYQRYGVSRSGAMDPYSLRLANILAGNPQGTACLEFALAGAVFEVTAKRLHFAFVGEFPLLINEEPFPTNASYTLARGERLEIVATDGTCGTHGYLAVLGGFAVEPMLGSCATHRRSGVQARALNGWIPDSTIRASGMTANTTHGVTDRDSGNLATAPDSGHGTSEPGNRHPGKAEGLIRDPLAGTALQPAPGQPENTPWPRRGTTLITNLDESPFAIERQLPRSLLRPPAKTIRAVPGPQTDHFNEDETRKLFHTTWRISANSDRMGFSLDGAKIQANDAGSMISEPVSPGSIQVPASGQSIVLMPDCGTVGGYPKIATVISVDRGRLAQLRQGSDFGFESVSVEQAQKFLREAELSLEEVEQGT